MEKAKTIGIHFFANTELKAKSIVLNGAMTAAYPLYVSVVYDKSNTKIRVVIDDNIILVTENLEQLQSPEMKRKIKAYRDFLKEVVQLEIKNKKGDFKLAGLSKRLEFYQRKISDVIGKTVVGVLFDFAESKGVERNMAWASIPSLSTITNATVLDWMMKDEKRKVLESLKNKVFKPQESIDYYVELVDYIIDYNMPK